MTVNRSPFLPKRSVPPLYDTDSLLHLEASMAQGYVILLSGAGMTIVKDQPGKKKSLSIPSQQAIKLGFSALTDGNVVDTCFGAKSGRPVSDQGQRQIKEVKQLLYSLAENNNTIPRTSVVAYNTAFQVIVKFRAETDHLNFISRCFRYGNLQRNAVEALEAAFLPLEQAIQASN